MTSSSRNTSQEALRAALNRPPPAGLDVLEPAELAKLATLLTDAKQRQKSQVDVALTESLGHIPLLLRGTVRKILDL